MGVFRINKSKDYTIMSNHHLKEKKMSLKAKGLLSEMLSLPENWDYSINGLVAINKENETSIKATLDELKEFRYLVVSKKLPNETKSGRIEYVYDIYEKPKQEVEKQGVDFLGVEFLGVENQGQYNINNKYINNKNIKYNIYGEFKNVKLIDEEYKKLEEHNLLSYIEKLSSYMESKGKRYKNHYATILNWSRKELRETNTPQWFDKNIDKKITQKEQQELNDLLKDFKEGRD